MTTDFSSETFELSTDSHLADRAKLGSAPAFDELVRRHSDTAIAIAMVVTGDALVAVSAGARAFTDVLDQMSTGGYSIDDRYLPGLLRSSRELALADPTADAVRRERMDSRLPELARTTRWLATAVALDAEDLALALDVEDTAVAGIVTWTDAAVADHAEAVDSVLSAVRVLVPTTFAVETRSIWRRWLATAGFEAPVGTASGVVAIESVASRILRGAAVVLIVAGAIGAAAGIASRGDNGGTTPIAQRASAEQPMDRGQRSASGTDGFDTSSARQALANTDLGPVTPAVMTPTPMVVTPVGAAHDVRVPSATADAGSSWMWKRAKSAVTGTAAPSRSNRGTQGSAATTSGSAASSPSSPTASPSSPALPAPPAGMPPAIGTPTAPAGPATAPATPVIPAAPPVNIPAPPKPPVTPPAVPTPPPVTLPPVKVPTVTLPPVTVPPVLAPVVGTVTGTLGGLLGGGR